MAEVCAVIPTFNRPDYLIEAVESLLAQTVVPDRIVVADDGSDTATAAALAPYGDRVSHSWAPNAGKSAALNRTLQAVDDELIWIFDDDDVADPTALERMKRALTADPDASFAYGRYGYLVERDGAWRRAAPTIPWTSIPNLKLAILERCFLFQPGMLVRRSAYRAVGPFDESLARSQDYDMLLRLSRRFRGVEAEGVLFHQRQHGGDRGPSHARLPAATRQQVWAATDARIFERIADDYALEEFGDEGRTDGEAGRAQALLNRAAVMARKGLWERAAADMAALARMTGSGSVAGPILDPSLLQGIFRIQSYATTDPRRIAPFRDALHRLPTGRRLGRDIVRPLLPALRWTLRRRDFRRSWTITRIIALFLLP